MTRRPFGKGLRVEYGQYEGKLSKKKLWKDDVNERSGEMKRGVSVEVGRGVESCSVIMLSAHNQSVFIFATQREEQKKDFFQENA